MVHRTDLAIICTSAGVAIGIFSFSVVFYCIQRYKKHSLFLSCVTANVAFHKNGQGPSVESCASHLESVVVPLPDRTTKSPTLSCLNHCNKNRTASASGIPKFSYKDIQKATQNFSTILGEGSFGPVYKATMPGDRVVAVKMLASYSRQGEKEFHTEVTLLGRLHHRNLVNLVGYCVDKGQHMLVYEYMKNGSLERLLYSEEDSLSWDERLQIALDISHGIEYLHEGAVPPVVHRDLKSANILLDDSMRAKVADFGLSKDDMFDGHRSSLKGTYGYMDPAYISTSKPSLKCDIYSLGVIIFELITAIHPQQNLMDYVNLAGMEPDGGVDEILDKRLAGKCNLEEVKSVAEIALRCLDKTPRKRPNMGKISESIAKIKQRHLSNGGDMSFVGDDLSGMECRIEDRQVEWGKLMSRNENK